MKKDDYESLIAELLAKARPVNHTRSPCEKDFIPSSLPEVSMNFFLILHQIRNAIDVSIHFSNFETMNYFIFQLLQIIVIGCSIFDL